jgi:hypothetical protein
MRNNNIDYNELYNKYMKLLEESQMLKIELYMALFKDREDVYAKRWQNKQGKSGYSPVCLNEWVKGICDKPQVKCSECKI